MRVTRLVMTVAPALILPLCVLIGCDRGATESKKQKESSSSESTSTVSPTQTTTGALQEALKARTEVTAVQEEIIGLDADIRQAMRKVLAKAEAKQTAGNIMLTKDRYVEAVTEYNEAVRLYRQVVDGRKQLEKLAEAQRAVDAARTLAESSAKPEQLQKAKAVEMNADGYVKAGEVDLALAELDKARQAYEALTPTQEQATLEQAVAARTAMLVARQQIKGLPTFDESTTGVARAIRGQQRESGKGP